MAEQSKDWARNAFKMAHKGRLHRALKVPEDQTIPADKMRAALDGKHGPEVQKMAQAVHNISE